MFSLALFFRFQLVDLLISISRLQQIAEVLDTKMESILDFNSTQVFNQYYNKLANGIVHNQQVLSDDSIKLEIELLKNELTEIKSLLIFEKENEK